jgi:transcriptional regulator with XRE-family HTH domain
MSVYNRVLARRGGGRALAIARLKRAVLATLQEAFSLSGIGSQSDLARRLEVRRSAVNQVFNGDGNVRISTLAEYLHAMGYELDISLLRSGEPRAAALEGRSPRAAVCSSSSSAPIRLPAATGTRAVAADGLFVELWAVSADLVLPSTQTRFALTGARTPEGSAEQVRSTSLSSQIVMGTMGGRL